MGMPMIMGVAVIVGMAMAGGMGVRMHGTTTILRACPAPRIINSQPVIGNYDNTGLRIR
jgi:hypothetical protein